MNKNVESLTQARRSDAERALAEAVDKLTRERRKAAGARRKRALRSGNPAVRSAAKQEG